MPYSMTDFAALIKHKYPAYAEVPDDELVSRVVSKHPEYKAQVTLDPRSEIAFRKENPPATQFGDPNPNAGPSAGQYALAAGKGLAHAAGLPTTMDEGMQIGQDIPLNVATLGQYGIGKNAVAMTKDMLQGHVPIVGRPLEALAKPAQAVFGQNRPPSGEENLAAVESGTTLGAAAAAMHPAVGRGLGRMAEGAGGALDTSARGTMADVVDPSGANPLRETIGDQLRNQGARMGNPPEDMARLAREHGAPAETTSPILDEQGNTIQKTLTPEQQIWEEVSKAAEGSQARQPVTAGAKGRVISEVVIGTAAKVLGVPHAVIAGVLGGSELVGIARKIMTNPMWKTTSAVVKTDLAAALRSGDTATVLNIGSKVLGGIGLADPYGHDEAVHDAVKSALEQAQGDPQVAHQILAGQEAVYVNPDGTEVPIPWHITRAFTNQIGGHVPNSNQRMASGTPQGGQDQTGRASGVPPAGLRHDFAGNAIGPAPNELQNYRAGWGPIK